MNSEIVARLQNSFSGSTTLPIAVQQAVEDEAEAKGCTPSEALTNLVLSGQANGGQVLNIRIAPGMTLQEIRDALSAMVDVVPDAESVIIERE